MFAQLLTHEAFLGLRVGGNLYMAQPLGMRDWVRTSGIPPVPVSGYEPAATIQVAWVKPVDLMTPKGLKEDLPMKKGLVTLLATGALVLSTMAFAAPQPLTNADLDKVTAGTGVLDWFLGGTAPTVGAEGFLGTADASGANSVAVDGDGSANAGAGALADTAGVAVNGDTNSLTYDPSDSAIAYENSQAINAGDNGEGAAVAVENSQANYSDDPSDSAVNLGTGNVATNFADNGDVGNATDNAIALGDGYDGANALGQNNQAFEDNGDVAVASNGVAIGDAYDAATNIGDGNIAIEDPSDVTFAQGNGVAIEDPSDVALAQDNGTAIENDGELAMTESGIAFANPSDTALAYGAGSIALEDPDDVAVASENGIAVNADDDVLIADNGSQAFAYNDDVANTTGSGAAIATDGDVAYATDGAVAISDASDVNLAENGNAAQSTSDGQAVAGNNNQAIYQDAVNAIAATGNAQVNVTNNTISDTTIDDGSAAVIGDNNQVSSVYDDATIDVSALGNITGVIAKNATVTDSFNVKEVDIDVTVDITNSFNVTTNSLDVSGQNGVSAIAVVNALGNPDTGINLNVTSATSSSPTVQAPGVPAATIGTATATTTLTQLVINGSSDITITF